MLKRSWTPSTLQKKLTHSQNEATKVKHLVTFFCMCNFVHVPQFKCALTRFAIGQDFAMILRKSMVFLQKVNYINWTCICGIPRKKQFLWFLFNVEVSTKAER